MVRATRGREQWQQAPWSRRNWKQGWQEQKHERQPNQKSGARRTRRRATREDEHKGGPEGESNGGARAQAVAQGGQLCTSENMQLMPLLHEAAEEEAIWV